MYWYLDFENCVHISNICLAHKTLDIFNDYGESNRYKIMEIFGKGRHGVVSVAFDTFTNPHFEASI